MLSFDRDGDDIGKLSGSTPIEDERRAGPPSVIMSGFDEDTAQEDVSGLGDGTVTLSIPRRVFSRNETGPTHEFLWGGEATDISNLGGDGHGREGSSSVARIVAAGPVSCRRSRASQVRCVLGQ